MIVVLSSLFRNDVLYKATVLMENVVSMPNGQVTLKVRVACRTQRTTRVIVV